MKVYPYDDPDMAAKKAHEDWKKEGWFPIPSPLPPPSSGGSDNRNKNKNMNEHQNEEKGKDRTAHCTETLKN